MEVECTYRVTVVDAAAWTALADAAERAVRLNRNLTSYRIDTPEEGQEEGFIHFTSCGHDKTAIVRRIIAPIRSVFTRAGIDASRVQVVATRILPNGRSLTAEQGRTPKGTFTDPMLRQILADHGATMR